MKGREMAKMSAWETNWRSSLRGNRILTADFVSSSTLISSLSPQSHVAIRDSVASPSNSAPNLNNYTYQFNSTMAIVILIVACAFLLVGALSFYLKKCFSRPGVPTRPAGDQRREQKSEGLDRKVIETFPIVAYSAASMGKNSTECAVCLADFQEEEKTRLLPKCNHAFHPECIDMWLSSHSTCPLCRISLISESHSIAIDSDVHLQDSASQANLDGAAPVVQEELEGASERDIRLNTGVERAGERQAVLALSRSSRHFRQAAQEVENRERLAATSARYPAPNTVDERSTSSRWINKLRRSCSMEGFRSSAKVEASDSCAQSLVTEDKQRNDASPRENGVTIALKETSSFYSRSRSERIAQISIPAEQTEVKIASESKQGSEE